MSAMSSATNVVPGRRLPVRARFLIYLVLIAGASVMLIPFLWSITTSLKDPADVFSQPAFWIPIPPSFQAYLSMLGRIPFLTYAWNTVKVAGTVTLGQLTTCSLAGYAFARLKFPGRNVIFLLVLSTMMVPAAVTMIPNFILMSRLGLVDSLPGLIVPFIGSAYGTFLMRQFFLSFPEELSDAAKLDGCNPLMFFWHILLPNSKPILVTLGLMTFQWSWNEFQWALIMIRSDANRTLQLGLSSLSNEHYINWTLLMAASVLTNLPILVLFFVAQKQFVESISLTGLKG